MFKRLKESLKRFFFPPRGSPRWMLILPYAILGILTLSVLVGGAYAWDYTNSPGFCGTSCHTMPPEYAAYQVSPHARIACVECHIGREFIGNQIFRKAGDLRHVFATAFETYEYPIRIKSMRPARETCEKCHSPDKFADDSLAVIPHFKDDRSNTATSTYLILKTGGGSKRQGQGLGIHWHIVNKVEYYALDELGQQIPYVRVYNDDGSTTEYVDVESGIDPKTIDQSQMREMDCITCHNRITHRVYTPEESVDNALALGQIATDIPDIRSLGVKTLRGEYATSAEGQAAIAGLEKYYQESELEYYSGNKDKITSAIAVLQQIYADSVFIDQKVDWNTHPNNIGHIDSPGCFRCHDGKHLDANQQAIRLECNVCHSIPVVANKDDFVTHIEISRGPEPESHRSPNWISLHNQMFDITCSNCHSTAEAGTTSNTSFCSNSACHGTVFTFAGFDAPKLREILKSQLPTPTPAPTLAPVVGNPTYNANIAPLLVKCSACHGAAASGGLNLTTYADLMKGGKDGAVIIPNDSANSLLVTVQSGQHFANLTAEELALIIQWIDAGAPEQ
jgi:nitrate/TMAO reductase-like tetraheme cytochrome c subunit/mono/diheme cytochrome c family protein